MARGFAACVSCATTACSTGARRRNIIRTSNARARDRNGKGRAMRGPWLPSLSPQAGRGEERSGAGLAVHLLDVVPVDQAVPERLEVFRPGVAVVDVIGVLPDIAAEDRARALDQRAFAVGRLVDHQLAVLDGDPAPAGAELADAGGDEVGLRLGDAAEILVDRGLELGRNLVAAAALLHPL